MRADGVPAMVKPSTAWPWPVTVTEGIQYWREAASVAALSNTVPDCTSVGVVVRFWNSYQRVALRDCGGGVGDAGRAHPEVVGRPQPAVADHRLEEPVVERVEPAVVAAGVAEVVDRIGESSSSAR